MILYEKLQNKQLSFAWSHQLNMEFQCTLLGKSDIECSHGIKLNTNLASPILEAESWVILLTNALSTSNTLFNATSSYELLIIHSIFTKESIYTKVNLLGDTWPYSQT